MVQLNISFYKMNTPNWTNENTTKLIFLWEQFPELYAVSDRNYHNKLCRYKAMKNIVEEMKVQCNVEFTVEDIKKKVHGLRGQYLREKTKQQKSVASGSSADEIYKPKLWTFSMLQFLSDTTAVRASIDNLPSASTSETECEMETLFDGSLEELSDGLRYNTEETQPSEHIDEKVLAESGTSRSVTPNKFKCAKVLEKQNKGGATDFFNKASQSLNKLCEPIILPELRPQDDISTFIASAEAEMRLLKNKKILRSVKVDIMNIIYKAQEQEEDKE